MALTAEKPGIVERLSSALASANLAPNDEREVPVDLIAALGLLQVNPDGRAHDGREQASIDPAAELGAVLIRIKFAGDTSLGERAVLLLVRWIRAQRIYGRWKLGRAGDTTLERFARHALAEWLYPTCPVCHGRQVLGMERDNIVERRVPCRLCKGGGYVTNSETNVRMQCVHCRGFGAILKRKIKAEKPRPCHACSGTGTRRKGVDAERIRSLAVTPSAYEKFWVKRFAWLEASFDRINDLDRRGLQIQLSKRRTPTSVSR